MSVKELNTEQQILEGAKKVFIIKGFDGARMQEIADEAGINKALLHYYYRSKDKLFEAVFRESLGTFIPKLGELFNSDLDLCNKISSFVNIYVDMLLANPYLPMFILHEINRDPHRIIYIMKQSGLKPDIFIKQIQNDIKKKKIKTITPLQLLVNMLSLCIFPFAGRPIIQSMLFNNNKKEYDKFLLEREKEITKFILNSICND
jgi:TetR/AcrR family transcriptional regulator